MSKPNIPDGVITFKELQAAAEAEQARIDAMFEHDSTYITLNVTYPYHIELSRIPDYEALLQWTLHLSGKNWMTSVLVSSFIKKVCSIKGWDIHKKCY